MAHVTAVGAISKWTFSDNKVHGANMGPIWGRQDTSFEIASEQLGTCQLIAYI